MGNTQTTQFIGKHIQALRKQLGLTQEELAYKAGVRYTTLTKIESGVIQTSSIKIIGKLAKALGIQMEHLSDFIPNLDLEQSVQILKGEKSIAKLLDDVYYTLKKTKGEVYISGIDERKFLKADKEAIENQIKRLARAGIKEKLLSKEGDTLFFPGSQSQYRWMPQDFFNPTPFYVYDEKIAMVVWGSPIQVIIIKNSALADAYRKQFLFMWERAKVPGKTRTKFT